MQKIILKPLKSKKQLRNISSKKVVAAGFTDDKEQFFSMTFALENGEKQDVTIAFETRTPRVFISNIYTI